MRKALLALSLITLVCLVAGGAYAQSITGVVNDISTGAAISGAAVTNGSQTVYTDSSGAYSMTVASGSYTLYGSANGYLKTSQLATVPSSGSVTVNWSLTTSYGNQPIPAQQMGNNYIILAWNDLGMHCDQDDYSYFCVLPPFNTLHAQVFRQDLGGGALVTDSSITVSYAFPKKTNSTLHTNFWTYASQFGFNAAPNVGITGTPLAGKMTLDSNSLGWVAAGIPITPYDDDGTWDPYGTAVITVTDTSNITNNVNVVAPVSTEMMCSNCHGTTALDPTLNPQASVLYQHDKISGTTLYTDYQAGKLHLCGSCHQDNALGTPGTPGVESLSLAMHNFHKDKMTFTTTAANVTPDCYNCHPGPKTNCMRGIMSRAGKSCHDCHGDMYGMASSMQNGRNAWAQEPQCGSCHDSKHAENANTLYRNSVLLNTPSVDMNGKIYCEACHDSTHAELTQAQVLYNGTVLNAGDTSVPQKFQGDKYWIWNCGVCHGSNFYTPGATMHR